jgi:hypothetical protein
MGVENVVNTMAVRNLQAVAEHQIALLMGAENVVNMMAV